MESLGPVPRVCTV